jgi:Acetolactate synthase, small (regulatory) subunit
LTLVTDVSDEQMDQVVKQLYKLIDVIDVLEITPMDHIESEWKMVKLKNAEENVSAIKTNGYEYPAEIINEKEGSTMVQKLAEPNAINDNQKSNESWSDLMAIARAGPPSRVKGEINHSQ